MVLHWISALYLTKIIIPLLMGTQMLLNGVIEAGHGDKDQASGFVVHRTVPSEQGALQDQYLVLHSSRKPVWTFPKGHMKISEHDAFESAKRELEEETQIMKGYTLSALTAKNLPISLQEKQGKTVSYWKAHLTDPNTPVLVDKTEHDGYEWATKERAHELLLAEGQSGRQRANMITFLDARTKASRARSKHTKSSYQGGGMSAFRHPPTPTTGHTTGNLQHQLVYDQNSGAYYYVSDQPNNYSAHTQNTTYQNTMATSSQVQPVPQGYYYSNPQPSASTNSYSASRRNVSAPAAGRRSVSQTRAPSYNANSGHHSYSRGQHYSFR